MTRSPLLLAGLVLSATWATLASAQDDDRPLLFHTPARQTAAHEPMSIEGLLIDGQHIDEVYLRYRGQSERYTTVRMEGEGDVYRAVVPAKSVKPPWIEYYVQGTTTDGKPVLLYQSDRRPTRVKVLKDKPPPPRPAPVAEQKPSPEVPVPDKLPMPPPPVVEEKPGPMIVETVPQPERGAPDAGPARPIAAGAAPPAAATEFSIEDTPRQGADGRFVATAGQIRATGARTVAEALDTFPGITVTRDVAGFYAVALRGRRSTPEVALSINGHRMNNPYDGRAILELPIANVERIELVNGPNAGGIGGAINVVTDQREGVRASATVGTSFSFDGHANAAMKVAEAKDVGDLKLFGDADVWISSGVVTPLARDSLRPTGTPPPGDTKDGQLLINVGTGGTLVNEQLGSITASLRVLHQSRNALIGAFDALGTGSNLQWTTVGADVDYQRAFSSKIRFQARAHVDGQRTSRLFQLSWGTQSNPYCTVAGTCPSTNTFFNGLQELRTVSALDLGLDTSVAVDLPYQNTLSIGASASRTRIYQYMLTTNFDGASMTKLVDDLDVGTPPLRIPSMSVGGEALWNDDLWSRQWVTVWLSDRYQPLPSLTLVGGLGLQLVNLPNTSGTTPARYPIAQAPRIHFDAYYAALPQLTVFGSYGRSMRAPTIAEISESYASTGSTAAAPFLGRFTGNVSLVAGTIDAMEASVEWTQYTGQVRARIRGTGFYTIYSSPIDQVLGLPDPVSGTIPIANRGATHIFGGEAEARLFPAKRTSAWLNVSIYRARELTPGIDLVDLPQARLNLGVSMPLGDVFNLDAFVEAGGERRHNSRTPQEASQVWGIGSYSWLMLQLRTETFAQRFNATVTVQNVLGGDRFDDAPRTDLHQVPRAGRGPLGKAGLFATLNAEY